MREGVDQGDDVGMVRAAEGLGLADDAVGDALGATTAGWRKEGWEGRGEKGGGLEGVGLG